MLQQRRKIATILLRLVDADSMFLLQGIFPKRLKVAPHPHLFIRAPRINQVDNVDEFLLEALLALGGGVTRRDADLDAQVLVALQDFLFRGCCFLGLGGEVVRFELFAHGNGALLCVLLGAGDPLLGEGEAGEFGVKGRVVAGREVLELVKVGLRGWRGGNCFVLEIVLRIILRLKLR